MRSAHELIPSTNSVGADAQETAVNDELLLDIPKATAERPGSLHATRNSCRFQSVGSNSTKVLVGKSEGKRPLGRPRRRWEHNIKMDLQEVGRCCRDWMGLAQDRDRWRALVSTVMNFEVP